MPRSGSVQRIPSLDGLRAVSILLVMFAHWGLTASVPYLNRLPAQQFKYFGSLGVSIFFVISGFLITTLLRVEKRKTSTISLKNFYLRRVLRIFPAYYAYLAALCVFAAIGFIAVTPRDLIMSALYVRDYFPQATDWTNHTWSLAVEEQFYLIWPIMFHTRADTLLFGCLLALTRLDAGAIALHRRLDRLNGPAVAALVLFVLSPVLYYRFHGGYLIVAGYTLDNACIALLLIWAIDHRKSLAGRILNWKPVAAIGTLSYSLYLWHVIFISPFRGATIPFPLNVILTFVLAWCSFTFIEMPFNGLRRRFGSLTVATEPTPPMPLISEKAKG
jgi:peptidoglycan/LPS O-acetylase OafA/YrhL